MLDKLGPEPLEDLFTPEVLKTVLTGRKSPVKAVLLDQQSIAGIGNMYADEALFQARINPLEPAQNLDQRQILSLHSAIQFVLRRALSAKGQRCLITLGREGNLGEPRMIFVLHISVVASALGATLPLNALWYVSEAPIYVRFANLVTK